MKKAYIVVDTAYAQGVVALFTADELVLSFALEEKMAHGRELALVFEQMVVHAEDQHLDIVGIFSGLGPGSFVGVRIALATALGFSCARAIPLMGFCSHAALAASRDASAPFWLVMKASGDQCYVSFFEPDLNGPRMRGPSEVISLADALLKAGSDMIISDLVLQNGERMYGPTPAGLVAVAQKKLAQGLVDESGFIKPNYIKSPNVSLPKKNIILGP